MTSERVRRYVTRKLRGAARRVDVFLTLVEDRHRFTQRLTYREGVFYCALRACLSSSNLVFYDIGASIGTCSRAMAKVRNISTVYAFEPIPTVRDTLVRECAGLEKIISFPVAIGDTNESGSMFVNDFNPSSSLLNLGQRHREEFPEARTGHNEEVDVVRLDDFVERRGLRPPNIVKMDVQGFEDRVLRGGRETMRQATWCLLEMSLEPLYEGSVVFGDLHRMMEQLGFVLFDISGELIGSSGRRLAIDGLYRKLTHD